MKQLLLGALLCVGPFTTTYTMQPPREADDVLKCTICLNRFRDGQNIVDLACRKHLCHFECTVDNTCPLCLADRRSTKNDDRRNKSRSERSSSNDKTSTLAHTGTLPTSHVELLPHDVQNHALNYLLTGVDGASASRNIAGYLLTMKAENNLDKVQFLALRIADACKVTPLEAMLYLSGFGIPAATQWLNTREAKKEIGKIVDALKDWSRRVMSEDCLAIAKKLVPLFFHDLSYALNPELIEAAIYKDPQGVDLLLLLHPALKNIVTEFIFTDNPRPELLSRVKLISRHNLPILNMNLTNEQGKTLLMQLIDSYGEHPSAYRRSFYGSSGASSISDYVATTFLPTMISSCTVNATDSQGETALIIAARKNALDIVRLLLDNGADPFAEDLKGRTALSYAHGNTDMGKLFAEKLNLEDVRELFPR